MRRYRNPFLIIAIIILFVIVARALVHGALLRLPQYPEYFSEQIINSTDQDTIKEIKGTKLEEFHLKFDYSDVIGCKTGVPPWDCGIENLQIEEIYVQRNYFAHKHYIGKYFEYIVNSYRNKKGYTFRLYITKENLPHQFTNLHPVDLEREEYTIGRRIVTVQKLSDEGAKVLNFYLTSDDWYGYKLMGLIAYENQETISDSTSEIQEILEKLLKDH